MATGNTQPDRSRNLTWEIAQLFPCQGEWTESEFFELHSNRLIELIDGHLEVLPMPTWMHQLIVDKIAELLKHYVREHGAGRVLQAPMPITLFPRTIREPDVMLFLPGSEPDDPDGFPSTVDLAVEVVSKGKEARRRDYENKPLDYARAGIPEYWIVDPQEKKISVMCLPADPRPEADTRNEYLTHGVFHLGDLATGRLLPGFSVDVSQIMRLTEKDGTAEN